MPDAAGLSVDRTTPYLVRVPEAARITGLPASLIRKSFMKADKRPKNIPDPPPHLYIGSAVYIIADRLPEWIRGLAGQGMSPLVTKKRGRPTVAERIARRAANA